MAEGLSAKQLLFVKEYLIDLNATAAYKRAGYSGDGNVAEASASRMLSDVKVAAAVQKEMDKRTEKIEIDAEYVLRTIKDTIERCSQAEEVKVNGVPSGEYKFDSNAVLKGCELLGKHLKLFTEKVEHSGGVEIATIERKIVDPRAK